MDPFLRNIVGGAIGSAWGASPNGGAFPGPISTLSGYLRNDFTRSGAGDFANVFPTPYSGQQNTGTSFPPMMSGGGFGQIPGGFNWNYKGPTPGVFPIGASWNQIA